MKGLFIPEITAEMFRNGCLEGIEALMAEGEIYDIDYEPERQRGEWITTENPDKGWLNLKCPFCEKSMSFMTKTEARPNYCINCGSDMRGEK